MPIDRIVGVSTGALNAAVIAGNDPDDRVRALQAMWRSFRAVFDPGGLPEPFGTLGRIALTGAAGLGRRGLYRLRPASPGFAPPGSDRATSLYSTAPLRRTLARHVDFEKAQGQGAPRLSLGAMDVEGGQAVFFDSRTDTLRADHVIAATSMPPTAPAVRIDDRLYWDGGLAGERALQPVLDAVGARETRDRPVVAIVVDVASQAPRAPRHLLDAIARRDEVASSQDVRAASAQFFAAVRAAAWGLPSDPFDPRPESPVTARRQSVGVIQLRSTEDAALGWFAPHDYTAAAIERRMLAGRDQTLRALSETPVDFALFGSDPVPDLFMHLVRDGEIVDSRRRPMPTATATDDPTLPADAISLSMPAMTEADPAREGDPSTSSWTNIRAIRLETFEDLEGTATRTPRRSGR